jgi:hypothetical protein
MAERKRSERIPQAHHGEKSVGSRHDRRSWLLRTKPEREHSTRACVPLVGVIGELVGAMSRLLDALIACRLPMLVAGAMLAKSRLTAASWFRSAEVAEDWDRFYHCLQTVGQQAQTLLLPQASFGQ